MSLASATIEFAPSTSDTLQLNVESEKKAREPLHITLETSERASATVPVTLTVEVSNVASFAGNVIPTFGGVLSILRVTLVLTVFSARSTAVPEIT